MGHHKHGCSHHRRDSLDLTQADLDPGGLVSLLKYLTRLLFLTTLLSAAVVLAVSVLMLTHCRQEVRVVEDVGVGLDTQALCSHLTIPAYFVCVVIVVTIFGFGCVGRKVSGFLLMGVSGVALVMTVVVITTQECVEDVQDVHQALVSRLQGCGFAPRIVNSSTTKLKPRQELHRFEYLSDPQDKAACQNAAASLTTLCQDLFIADPSSKDTVSEYKTGRLINETGVEGCAREVWQAMYSLCMQDTEMVYPLLLTLPVFYMGIGLALVCIKHADLKAKSRLDLSRTRTSVGTDTDCSPTAAAPPDSARSVQHVLCRCISSVCVNHSLCFTCLLRGRPWSTASTSLRPSSRQSFPLREVGKDGGGEKGAAVVSVRVLRNSSSRAETTEEQICLMEDCV